MKSSPRSKMWFRSGIDGLAAMLRSCVDLFGDGDVGSRFRGCRPDGDVGLEKEGDAGSDGDGTTGDGRDAEAPEK